MNRDWIECGAPVGGFPWHGPEEPNTRQAHISSDHNLKRIWYLERAVEASRSVARVVFPRGRKAKAATCFLIAPKLILTNHHVFSAQEDTEGVRIQFDYRERFNGSYETPEEHTCDPTTFLANAQLDFVLVTLKEAPKRDYLKLRHGERPEREGHVAIIQHPNGGPLQAALRDNSLVYDDTSIVEYLANTESGSSGSPVFNDNWNVIALHSAATKDPTGKGTWYRNRGINIAAILAKPEADKLIPRPEQSVAP